MKYYIYTAKTWRATNAKQEEIHNMIRKYERSLLLDKNAIFTIVSEMQDTINDLNKKYPKTKKLVVYYDGLSHISCYPADPASTADCVFYISLLPIMHTYGETK